jgi:AcrR family transcriptional regulator
MNRNSSTRKRVRPLRTRFKEAVAEGILDAAEQVIAERGLARAAMGEIASAAGVAVGTVYNYFPDRDGLVRALFRSRRARLVPAIAALAGARQGESFEPRLRGLLRDLFELFDQHRRFLRVVIETDASRPPSSTTHTVLDQLLAVLGQVFAAGAAEGRLPSGHDERLARVAAGALRGLVFHQLERGGAFAGEAGFLADVLLAGAPGVAAAP